ncbi:helix-turn-helix transcriptional regulator [Pseudomonas sp. St316]|uniref:AraC family transcriptional regulator n=1 Tax=Pseudomonas sp. St316 TaxID=2678257 RepID=UPI001BB31CFD|nr:helix-turn-helix transcriptional regulator [Pseudomonas sp. St316]BBP59768.1 transcriptional regulator [Pseudomonas sp. St316]
MALASPPDLTDTTHLVQPLSRTYPSGMLIAPHHHEWGQLLYAQSGLMWVDTPGAALLVPPQRAVWLPPRVTHGIRVVSPLEMRNLYLRAELAMSVGLELEVLEVSKLLRELIIRRVALGNRPDPALRDALDNLLVLELREQRSAVLKVPMPAGGDRRLRNLCETVLDVPGLAMSFEQHAESVGASTRTLARLFHAELGLTFTEWRRQVQLAHAVAALLEGDSVGAIAARLGYTLSSFSEMFRRSLGIAPSAYKNAMTSKGFVR